MTSNDRTSLETPEVPVSWGELVDKITILEIKSQRLESEAGRANVLTELRMLSERARPLFAAHREADALKAKLTAVNEALWDIEDDIRQAEARKAFDADFIRLARSVYITNDERARLKRDINMLSASALIEEKSYKPY